VPAAVGWIVPETFPLIAASWPSNVLIARACTVCALRTRARLFFFLSHVTSYARKRNEAKRAKDNDNDNGMADRKVLNKYYEPDYDPLALPKKKRCKNKQCKVMMMLPMSVRCNTCGAYIWKGKKFNSRKETVEGETYLGIPIFRFYMRCDNCLAEFTILTDPQNADYKCEAGAHRNFDPKREQREEEARLRAEQEEEDKDAMRALERRTAESKREMDLIEALDEVRALNARGAKASTTDKVFESFAGRDAAEVMRQRQLDLEEYETAKAELKKRTMMTKAKTTTTEKKEETVPVVKKEKSGSSDDEEKKVTGTTTATPMAPAISFIPIEDRKRKRSSSGSPALLSALCDYTSESE
jgi:hypothetical protein